MSVNIQTRSQTASANPTNLGNAAAITIASSLDDGISPIIAESLRVFRRDLPGLLESHSGEWVAYQGELCLGFGASKTQLYQECLGKGLRRGEFLVECVEPEVARISDPLFNV